jgi:hypothetical protein
MSLYGRMTMFPQHTVEFKTKVFVCSEVLELLPKSSLRLILQALCETASRSLEHPFPLAFFGLSLNLPTQIKTSLIMSGTGSVGPISTEGAGDQRNKSEEEKREEPPPRFEEGKENAHQANDSSAYYHPNNSPDPILTMA